MHSISTLINRIIWGKQFIYLFKALNFSQKAVDKQKSAALKRLTQDGMMSGEYIKRSHGEMDPVNTMTPFCISTSKKKGGIDSILVVKRDFTQDVNRSPKVMTNKIQNRMGSSILYRDTDLCAFVKKLF